jgi:isopentenyl-diphosphate delta-isomerase
MSSSGRLNVVDEDGNIIGEETRENIHRGGLLHREVHVWFYTPKGEIVFQRRSKNKDTYPGLLDATVGGHVEIGDDYEYAALKEIEEETGIRASKDDLTFIQIMKGKSHDHATGMTNNVIRAVYAFRYEGGIGSLKVEKEEAVGFEKWPFEKLFNISENDRKHFIPVILEKEILGIFRRIQEL